MLGFENKSSRKCLSLILFLLLFMQNAITSSYAAEVSLSDKDLRILVGETKIFTTTLTGKISKPVRIQIIPQHDDLVQLVPEFFDFDNFDATVQTKEINLTGINPGHLDITLNVTSEEDVSGGNTFMKAIIQHSNAIYHISYVVGWIYFVAWSVSFYPQIYINFKRKSVVGLNFDFIALNIVGFVLYSLFNLGLFYIPSIQDEYFDRYPRGLNPVQTNDIFFSIHASIATVFTICQCFIYQRDNQTVSITARVILSVFAIFLIISCILAATLVITWLDFLYYCSYVKLSITLIKYVPQAYMNYKRKSTVGWSIGNIFLDFVGGTLSMLQMILNAHNYNDWVSIFGDPTKFGLGLFSVVFDIFFIIQHYVLYRNSETYVEIAGDNIPENENQSNNDDHDT